MSNKKEYEVTSPIKRNGKKYEVGDTMLLTEEEADGLHVKLANGSSGAQQKTDGPKSSPSMGINAKAAIKIIENSDQKDIEGFVIPEPEGTEDRKTVLEAWAAKQAEAEDGGEETKEKETKDSEKK